jgi:hypothetical protein
MLPTRRGHSDAQRQTRCHSGPTADAQAHHAYHYASRVLTTTSVVFSRHATKPRSTGIGTRICPCLAAHHLCNPRRLRSRCCAACTTYPACAICATERDPDRGHQIRGWASWGSAVSAAEPSQSVHRSRRIGGQPAGEPRPPLPLPARAWPVHANHQTQLRLPKDDRDCEGPPNRARCRPHRLQRVLADRRRRGAGSEPLQSRPLNAR